MVAAQAGPLFEFDTSRQFTSWLGEVGASIVFTTYQAGKLFFVGTKPDGELNVFNRPLRMPPFIDRLAAEDRCHLNGLALKDGALGYATAVSTSNIADGWRDHRRDGGVVIDIASNEIIATGLSMPHSPRFVDGRLWLHNSGTGEFDFIDMDSGKFEAVAFCPGYLRGLDFIGPYAVAGLSEPRENKTFNGLALQDRLEKEGATPKCGLYVIDTCSGDIVHWARIQGVVHELYDVSILPGLRNPALVGFRSDEIRRMISIET